jgi:hypothetical protein
MKIDNTPKFYTATKNTMLAAGLAAMGCEFYTEPFEKIRIKGEEVWMWRFKGGRTPCGRYTLNQLIDWWHDDDWFAENYPNHPWALVISGILTKDYLVRQMKDQPTKVAIKKKSKTWVVYENSDLYKRLTEELS